jgi:DedD protein
VRKPSAASEETARKPSKQTPRAAEKETDKPAVSKPTTVASATKPNAAAPSSGDAAVEGAGAWVVQVGSFAQGSNAVALRDKLRAAGFSAFAETSLGGKKMTRVYVGPELSRGRANALASRLQRSSLGLSGIVVSYP